VSPGRSRITNYLIPGIDGIGLNSVPVPGPAEIAQVGNRTRLPKQGVERLEIDKRVRVKGCAFARSSGNVAAAVDPERDSIQIARVGWEFLDFAIFPDDGLELKQLGAGHAGFRTVVSAVPATTPRLLIALAKPLFPPSVGSGLITKYCHTKGRQVVPKEGSPNDLKPQKSSPFGSRVDVAELLWAPNAAPSGPASPGVPMSIFTPWYQRTACTEVSATGAAPLTRLLLVTEKGWPTVLPTAPRSVTV